MRDITIVDIGAGYGSLVALLWNIFYGPVGAPGDVRIGRYVAVDKSPALLRAALMRAAELGIPAKYFLFDLDSGHGTAPGAEIGDIVSLSYTLTHVRNVAAVLRLAVRVAKRNGVIMVVDADYASAVADGDEALIRTIAGIRKELRHTGFADLDSQAASLGLRRASGLFDGVEHFGPRERSPKRDALGFIGNFKEDHAVRIAWEGIRGGTLVLPQIRRVYVKSVEYTDAIASVSA